MMTLELTLAAALLGPAQVERNVPITQIAAGRAPTDGLTHHHAVDEQIEVMRALLLRRLGREPQASQNYSWTPASTSAPANAFLNTMSQSSMMAQPNANSPYGSYRPAAHHAPLVEGAYLDGYGVVFAATVDATPRDPRPKADESKAPPALSEWERTQRQLRGEAVPEKQNAAAKEPPLGDVVLKLLAENGKHFTALKDDERVAVVVTFRGAAGSHTQAVQALQSAAGYGAQQPTLTAPGSAVPSPAQPVTAEPYREDRVATMENLGDLHLKQGQSQRAIEAYAKAVGLAEGEWKEWIKDSDRSSADKRVHGTMMKLAQAYIAAGKLDEARDTLEQVRAWKERSGQLAKATAKPSMVSLPARLTVSAPKKLLDQAGSGKVSLDEFRKLATVEFVPAGKAAGE